MEYAKQYAPVGLFEKKTSHCPLYVAWVVLDEVRNYFWTELPEGLDDALAERAEIVFARNPYWRKKFQSSRGRAYLLMFMRHWLSSLLRKKQLPLARELPDSFKIGHPLPSQPLSRPKKIRRKTERSRPFRHYVHGCELLTA